jgi:uncharacterized damage-inducible protein DinB
MTTMNGETMLPEFDQEFAATRKCLERVPDDRFDWKPHERSFSLRDLAAHLSNIPEWLPITLETEELDFTESSFEPFVPGSTEEILDRYDRAVEDAREALAGATPEQLREPWTLKSDGTEIFTMPKGAVIRSFVFNHNIHHRAQLGVYLRLLDVPVPGPYGPSADEEG